MQMPPAAAWYIPVLIIFALYERKNNQRITGIALLCQGQKRRSRNSWQL
jgi:hypothetical protein